MPDRLAVIVPTRGRPENIRKVIAAWDFTGAWDVADLVLAVDNDDPKITDYEQVEIDFSLGDNRRRDIYIEYSQTWVPMVHKLNERALNFAENSGAQGKYFAIGFAGDDHLPQTIGWAARYLTVLRELGTGMVYGDDGYQGEKLSTEWAVTADAVRALGRMVPAPVDHMYCDNSMMDLFGGAGCLRHLPEVRIEHMHPIVGKAPTDAQYQRVNHRDQFRKDRNAYEGWTTSLAGMPADLETIRALRAGMAEVRRTEKRERTVRGSMPRKVDRYGVRQRSGPSSERRRAPSKHLAPREFAGVRGATPDEIGVTLADFASQVPADQEIVELGVFQGRTALMMAWGARQGLGAHLTGIDPWDLEGNVYDPPFTDANSRWHAFNNIESLGYHDNITLIQGFSEDVARTVFSGADGEPFKKNVGLLYVDGDHTKEGARRDIEAWAPHLAPGATIAVDDYGHPDWPGVGEAVDELVAEGFLEPIEVIHDRLAVTRLTSTVENQGAIQELTGGGGWVEPKITAITGEGVSPSPYPAADGQVAVPDEIDAMFDSPPAAPEHTGGVVGEGELGGISAGTPIDGLNLGKLRTLGRHRQIKTAGVPRDTLLKLLKGEA